MIHAIEAYHINMNQLAKLQELQKESQENHQAFAISEVQWSAAKPDTTDITGVRRINLKIFFDDVVPSKELLNTILDILA